MTLVHLLERLKPEWSRRDLSCGDTKTVSALAHRFLWDPLSLSVPPIYHSHLGTLCC